MPQAFADNGFHIAARKDRLIKNNRQRRQFGQFFEAAVIILFQRLFEQFDRMLLSLYIFAQRETALHRKGLVPIEPQDKLGPRTVQHRGHAVDQPRVVLIIAVYLDLVYSESIPGCPADPTGDKCFITGNRYRNVGLYRTRRPAKPCPLVFFRRPLTMHAIRLSLFRKRSSATMGISGAVPLLYSAYSEALLPIRPGLVAVDHRAYSLCILVRHNKTCRAFA